jgi:hypothetical protein
MGPTKGLRRGWQGSESCFTPLRHDAGGSLKVGGGLGTRFMATLIRLRSARSRIRKYFIREDGNPSAGSIRNSLTTLGRSFAGKRNARASVPIGRSPV